MSRRMWTVVSFLTLSLAAAPTVSAQNGKSATNQGATPNGKPFQQIQAQFAVVDQALTLLNQQIQGIQTQISNVENTLQAQISTINGTLTSLQTQVADAAAAASSLEARVTANEASIAALNAAIAGLQAQLTAAQALIAGNSGDITALQAQVNNIQSMIGAHSSQIAALQQQTAQLAQFRANLENGNCQTGQAIRDIAPGGFIACTQSGGGNLQTVTTSALFYLNYGFNQGTVSCPAGYVASSSGFSAPSYYESTGVVTGVGYNFYSNPVTHYEYYYDYWWGSQYYTYTTYDNYTIPYSNYSTVVTSPTSLTQSVASGNYASLQLQFTPRNNFYGYYFQVIATCAKTQ